MRCDYVRRDFPRDVQERAELAPRFNPGLRKHPHCPLWKQSRHQGQKGQSQIHRLSSQEKSSGTIVFSTYSSPFNSSNPEKFTQFG